MFRSDKYLQLRTSGLGNAHRGKLWSSYILPVSDLDQQGHVLTNFSWSQY